MINYQVTDNIDSDQSFTGVKVWLFICIRYKHIIRVLFGD